MNLKHLIRDYVIPPAYLHLRARFARRAQKNVDPRRHWLGEEVPSLPYNTPLFQEAGIVASCITFNQESRDAFWLKGSQTLNLRSNAETTCRIAVAGSARDTGLSGTLGGQKVFRLSEIDDGRWHILRFDVPVGGGTLTLTAEGSSEVAVSHPILTERIPAENASKRSPKTVIVLLLDSIAFDLLERYGTEWGKRSHIHRFFENGLNCERAFSQAEWTYPAIYSMMTAESTLRHGCFERFLGKGLETDREGTLPQEMMRRGYVTMGFSTSKMYHPAYNAHLGFHRFFYQPFGSALSFPAIADQALAHLESHGDCKNFLFLDIIDLHAPWHFNTEISEANLPSDRICNPILEFDRNFVSEGSADENAIETLSRRGLARLRDVDLSLSRIFHYLERSDLADDAVVLLLADHGDNFRSGGQSLLCRLRTHVPFMLKGPGVPAGKIDGFVAAGVDVMPTLLRLVDGTDFSNEIDGQAVPPFGPVRDHVISESVYEGRYQAAVRSASHVYHFQCAYRYNEANEFSLEEPAEAKLFPVDAEANRIDVKEFYGSAWTWHHDRLLAHLEKAIPVEPWLRSRVN